MGVDALAIRVVLESGVQLPGGNGEGCRGVEVVGDRFVADTDLEDVVS